MTRQTIKVFVERYAYPRVSGMFGTPATVVGCLAVHRPVHWWEGDTLCARKPDGWTVAHVASGMSVASVHAGRCIGEKRADLIAWAKAWQEACPEWFALIADAADVKPDKAPLELTRAAIDAGRKLSAGVLA